MQGLSNVDGTRGIGMPHFLDLLSREVVDSAWRAPFAVWLITLSPLQLGQFQL